MIQKIIKYKIRLSILHRVALRWLIVWIGCLGFNGAAFAFEIPVPLKKALTFEAGSSLLVFNNLHPAQRIALLGYHWEWRYFFTETLVGGWGAARNTYLAGGSVGASFAGFSVGTGAAWLTRTSDALSTHWQLIQTLRYTICDSPLFIGFRHFSNGHRVFRHHQIPNHGENFIVLGLQVEF